MKINKASIITIIPHLLFVIALATVAIFFDPRPVWISQNDGENFQTYLLIIVIPVLVCFYANMLFLVPQILAKMGWIIYLLTILGLTVAIVLSINLFGYQFNSLVRPIGPLVFLLFVSFSASTSIRLNSDRVKTNQQTKADEYESLKSELSLLRSQITPHFMFNVLNTLTSLARKKSNDIEDVIIRISNLMRYMLYNTHEKKITLAKEIDFLNSYLEIQKLRFGDSINVSFTSKISDPSYLMESMLLLPLIENAFKHGTGTVDNPSITIHLLAKNGILEFEINNLFNPEITTIKEAYGIGNKNVQKRLSFLYKDKHEFTATINGNTFTAKLTLVLV